MSCSNGTRKKASAPSSGAVDSSAWVCGAYGQDSLACRIASAIPSSFKTVNFPDVNAFCERGQIAEPENLNWLDFALTVGSMLKNAEWATYNQFPIWCECVPDEPEYVPGQCSTSYKVFILKKGTRYGRAVDDQPPSNPSGGVGPMPGPLSDVYSVVDSSGVEKLFINSADNKVRSLGDMAGFEPGYSYKPFIYRTDGGEDNCGDEIEKPPETPDPPNIPPEFPPETPPPELPPGAEYPPNIPPDYCPTITLAPIESSGDSPASWGVEEVGDCEFLLTLRVPDMCDLTAIEDALDDMRSQLYPALGIRAGGNGPFEPGDNSEDGEEAGAEEDSSWPITVPEVLTDPNSKTVDITTIPSAFAWLMVNLDALAGQYPVKIELSDTDPYTEGGQPQVVEFPNQAELLAETFGLAYESNFNSELMIQVLYKLIPEVLSARTVAITNQDFLTTIAEFMGMRTKDRAIEIPMNFNPENVESLNGILEESTQQVQGVVLDDPHTVVEWLQKIQYWAQVAGAPHFRGKNQLGELEGELASFTKDVPEETRDTWDAFIDHMNSKVGPLNAVGKPTRPRVYSVDNLRKEGTIVPQDTAD